MTQVAIPTRTDELIGVFMQWNTEMKIKET